MTVLDTPDWAKPLPGGSRTLVNTGFNLASAGGNFVTPWFNVTSYNGLYVETNGFAFASSFGQLQVQFQDVGLTQPIFPTYTALWRGDMAAKLNVPVLGAQARIVIQGPADNANAALLAVGHGGGGSSSYGHNGEVLCDSPVNQTIAAGGNGIQLTGTVREGPAVVAVDCSTKNWQVLAESFDANGNLHRLASRSTTTLFGDTIPLWIPPAPIRLVVFNLDAAAQQFNYALIAGRD